ncbi:hypothetical protein GCM10022267_74350 [Lentzea roselyniae]|uniref:Type I restriction modification DNA specificity domain-containing protein n=1 Tax=Lentzea roselyniae TaxID=531940 RepID=A0ABP7C1I2_9PSEU
MTSASIAPWLSTSRWPTVPIRYVAKLGTGHTPSRNVPEYWENCTVPWVTLADVWQLRDGTVDVIKDTKEKISQLGLANSSAVKYPAGTVILSRTASVGFSAILGADMATTQDFATWTCGPRLDRRYLLHALRAMASDLKRVAAGSTHKTIYMPDIEQLRIPLPSLDEQRRIADFVDGATKAVDSLVAATGRQFALLDAKLLEFLRVMTTSGGTTELSSTGVPWMPKMASGWTLHKLSRIFATGSGTTPRSDNPAYFDGPYGWVNTADLRDSVIFRTGRTVTTEALRVHSALKVYRPEALIVAMYGATVGRVGVLDSDACVNQACCVLYRPTGMRVKYLFHWFVAHRSEIMSLASGGGQPNISQELVRSFRVPAPDLAGQDCLLADIDRYTERIGVERAHLAARMKLLGERRQALITAAVTGQIDVSTARGIEV